MHHRSVQLDILRDPRLAVHATRGLPIWLFDLSGTKLLFANPAGAALFGFAASSAAMAASFENTEIAKQIARSAATLRQDGTPRLERLRGMGMPFGRPLICTCSKVTVASATAILVIATEPCHPVLTLAERARRLIESKEAVAAFDPDGNLLHATPSAAKRLGGVILLADIPEKGEILYAGEGADAVTLVLFSGEEDRPSQNAGTSVNDATENAVDLSPIADAIAAMTVPQPSHCTSQDDGIAQSDLQDTIESALQPAAGSVGNNLRRHPLRFVWETDAENRFTITDRDFLNIAGPRTTSLMGRFWNEISAKLALDPEGRIAHAMVSRDTWSGIEVDWPAKDGQRIKIALCGIPAFDRERLFCGYRGWGVVHGQPLADLADTAVAAVVDAEPTPAHAEAKTDIQSPVSNAEAPVALPVETMAEPADVIEAPENVVPFRATGQDARPITPAAAEQTAFQELTSRLAMRLKGADELARGQIEKVTVEQFSLSEVTLTDIYPNEQTARDLWPSESDLSLQTAILDHLPAGVLLYRLNSFIYANPAFLTLTGHASIGDFAQAGGLDSLFIETVASPDSDDGQSLRIAAPARHASMGGRLVTLPIDDDDAMALVLFPNAVSRPATHTDARSNLSSLLDIATDGVVVIDRDGQIVEANAGAARLFGYEKEELPGQAFSNLFAPESERAAKASLERLTSGGSVGPIDDGREFIGRRRHGSLLFLNMLLARADQNSARFCAIFRDITRWKSAEKDLTAARQQAEKASSAKSEFLARISHEMRTPLNAIIGFSDVMMEERFGPIGNDRYRDYLKDIKASGSHLVSLLNDLLDLSKIEAGKMELNFERVNLNDLTQQSVAIMQAQANRARIIVRTALSMNVPVIVADPRSVRQIILNLLSNSIKFTSRGGQVIVSTAATDRGDVMLRVRDTGVGMSEKDIEIALQPFRQLATSSKTDGTGLGLPLTKAMTEANRARFSIKSAVNSGTMVEIVFPAARVLAE